MSFRFFKGKIQNVDTLSINQSVNVSEFHYFEMSSGAIYFFSVIPTLLKHASRCDKMPFNLLRAAVYRDSNGHNGIERLYFKKKSCNY